jgi:festuclavine dehydrogenase
MFKIQFQYSYIILIVIQVAALLSKKLGRKITLVNITEEEAAFAMTVAWGLPDNYARILAQLDTAIRNKEEERINDIVLRVTGREPKTFEEFVNASVVKGV